MRDGSPQPNVQTERDTPGFGIRFWTLVVLTGIGAGIGGAGLMKLLRAVQHLAWAYDAGEFLTAVQRASAGRRILVLACAGVLAGVGRKLLRATTGGHGGELSEAIWFRSGQLPLARTLSRAVLSIVGVGLGASVGREGALKQTGGAVASALSRWARLSPAQRRLLAACGAGAGMAAAYNVPFGGALFALEVLLGAIDLPLVLPAAVASLIATAVSWIWLPRHPTYSVPEYPLWLPQLLWAPAAGVVLGLASALYVHVIGWADSRKPKQRRVVWEPILVLTALGAAALLLPQLLGNGKNVVQDAFVGGVTFEALVALPLLKLAATSACLGSGVPGGLFTPTMTYGALLGGLLGYPWAAVAPGPSGGSFAVIGAAAVLAATTQGPISAVVLTLELIHHGQALIVPMVLAVASAMLVARAFGPRSIYSVRIHRGEALAVAPPRLVGTAFGSMLSDDYGVVSSSARYPALARRLVAAARESFPLYVVDERGRLVGRLQPRESRRVAAPPGIVTASDLATPVDPLVAGASAAEAMERLARDRDLPVVDAASGRLVGAVATRAPRHHSKEP